MPNNKKKSLNADGLFLNGISCFKAKISTMTPWNLKNLQMTCIFKARTIQKGKISLQSSEAWENQCHITFFGLRISFIYIGNVYIPQSKDIHNFHFCLSLGRSVDSRTARTSDWWFFSTHWTTCWGFSNPKAACLHRGHIWRILKHVAWVTSDLLYFLNGDLPSSSNHQ